MRPRNVARPAAAGALSVAITSAAGHAALAETATTTSAPDPTAQAVQKPRIAVRQRKLDVRSGAHTAVSGAVTPGIAGVTVALELRRGHGWRTIDRDRTDAAGRYALREHVRRTGSTRARVRVAGARGVLPARRGLGRLNVYRHTYASWYGPGLYGSRTGCGGTLSTGRLGVAHKSLPCGTMVTFKHGKRSVRVPVIDRGPYVGGREYDLTAATAQRLSFRGHGRLLTTR
jgi:rare lipoprotein A